MIVADPAEKRFDVRVDGVIASDGDADAAAVRHLPGTLVDRARHVIRGWLAVDASTGHINRGPGGAKLESDAASRTTARTSNQRDGLAQL